uniref:biotin/lipoyl-containing protein n=1 Tax=Streptomyces sp. NRRL B-24572 TaxID=1962156 RepID=UPI0015C5112C
MTIREFKMPDVGEGLTEAEILKWYVQPGDTVTDGQVVCEVETAKAAVELPIPFDGTVHELLFSEGTTVDVGQVIISVNVGGGAAPEEPAAPVAAAAPAQEPVAEPAAEPEGRQPVLVGYGVAASSTKRRARRTTAAPAAAQVAPAASVQVPEQLNGHGPVTGDRPLAKPPVRKLAKDLGVDLATVTPTGPDGIITREDVHAAAATGAGASTTGAGAGAAA